VEIFQKWKKKPHPLDMPRIVSKVGKFEKLEEFIGVDG
jgi:hypothetical protein